MSKQACLIAKNMTVLKLDREKAKLLVSPDYWLKCISFPCCQDYLNNLNCTIVGGKRELARETENILNAILKNEVSSCYSQDFMLSQLLISSAVTRRVDSAMHFTACSLGQLPAIWEITVLPGQTTLNHFTFCMTILFTGPPENKIDKRAPYSILKEMLPVILEWLHLQLSKSPIPHLKADYNI